MFNYKNWTTLKAASKVAFKRIAAVDEVKDSNGVVTTDFQPSYTILEQKSYNPDTGEEIISNTKVSLLDLEDIKIHKTAEKAKLQTEIAEIGKMITQIKKV